MGSTRQRLPIAFGCNRPIGGRGLVSGLLSPSWRGLGAKTRIGAVAMTMRVVGVDDTIEGPEAAEWEDAISGLSNGIIP